MQVFFSRQFLSLRFTMPGGLPGPGGENGSETPPVPGTQKAKKPKGKAACKKKAKPE